MESYARKEEVKVIPDSHIIEVGYDYGPPRWYDWKSH